MPDEPTDTDTSNRFQPYGQVDGESIELAKQWLKCTAAVRYDSNMPDTPANVLSNYRAWLKQNCKITTLPASLAALARSPLLYRDMVVGSWGHYTAELVLNIARYTDYIEKDDDSIWLAVCDWKASGFLPPHFDLVK